MAELATLAGGGSDVDPFGADPQLQDLVAPFFARSVPVRVTGSERLPGDGPALLVTNRGLGVLEPTALSVAVSQECGRRLRVVATCDGPESQPIEVEQPRLLRHAGQRRIVSHHEHGAACRLGE